MGLLFGKWRSRPVDLEERAGYVGHPELVFFQIRLDFGDLFGVEVGDVLVPHGAEFNPVETEVLGGNLAGPAKVRCQLVVDYGEAKRAGCPEKACAALRHGAIALKAASDVMN